MGKRHDHRKRGLELLKGYLDDALNEERDPKLRAQSVWVFLSTLDSEFLGEIIFELEDSKQDNLCSQFTDFAEALSRLLNDGETTWGYDPERKSSMYSIVSEELIESCELYDVFKQMVQIGDTPSDTMEMTSVKSKAGDYAGDVSDVKAFFDKRGIAPELRDPQANVCSIGWSEKEQKYYGWSHRAFHGYGIGDKSFDGRHTIETKEQARESASAFAEDVS